MVSPVARNSTSSASSGSLRPERTRGSAKSPQLKFQDWHPGSHPAAQRRLEGFTRFPHKAGSFARKSKFINSVFQHEQTKASELDSQISQGLSTSPSTASSPTGKDSPFPPTSSWPGPSLLSGKPASGGACVRCAAWEHLATAALAARARQQSWLRKDHKQQGWPLGARANTAHSSQLPRVKTHNFNVLLERKFS